MMKDAENVKSLVIFFIKKFPVSTHRRYEERPSSRRPRRIVFRLAELFFEQGHITNLSAESAWF
jgi:hypothetical protein